MLDPIISHIIVIIFVILREELSWFSFYTRGNGTSQSFGALELLSKLHDLSSKKHTFWIFVYLFAFGIYCPRT